MDSKEVRFLKLGALFVYLGGTINHSFGAWTGFHGVSPSDESVFQHSRMVVLPWVLFLIACWWRRRDNEFSKLPQNHIAGAASLVVQSFGVVGFYYFFCSGFGLHGLALDIINFTLITALGVAVWIWVGRYKLDFYVDAAAAFVVYAALFSMQLFCTYGKCDGNAFVDFSTRNESQC